MPLVEAAVVAVLAGRVVLRLRDVADARVGEAVRREERAAAHAGVHVALQLEHHLLADVVRHHALRGTLRRELGEVPVGRPFLDVILLKDVDELRERRRHVHAHLVLHALDALLEHLLDDHREVLLLLLAARLVEVHVHGDERRLAVRRHERDHLVLDRLHAAHDLVAHALLHDLNLLRRVDLRTHERKLLVQLLRNFLAAHLHERREVRERDGLPAVLVGRHLRDDLRSNVARR